VQLSIPTELDMQALGRDLARLARPGDLIILDGPLGAGKTLPTQGIGAGLTVNGAIISPTFVIARIHRSLVAGPDLIHVDAYRLGEAALLDDLDLEALMPGAVTVIEWGKGLAEQLSADHLLVEIARSDDPLDDTRLVTVSPRGPRWDNLWDQWQSLVNDDMGRDAQADARGDEDD
jgi:tRNA threonylcarbamoyladenosine biosynthesis protein TsaE